MRKFQEELKLIKTLDHPNIFEVFEFYETNEAFYLITEYLEGGELFQFITESQKLTHEQIFIIFE